MGREAGGDISDPGKAAFSPAALNAAEAPALFCSKSEESVPCAVFGESRVQTPAWLPSTSAAPFGVPAAPQHSLHGIQLQPGLGPAALVLSYYFVKLPECP